jgi:hypothetical protein
VLPSLKFFQPKFCAIDFVEIGLLSFRPFIEHAAYRECLAQTLSSPAVPTTRNAKPTTTQNLSIVRVPFRFSLFFALY